MAGKRTVKANGESIREHYLASQAPAPIIVELHQEIKEELRRLKEKRLQGRENLNNVPIFNGGSKERGASMYQIKVSILEIKPLAWRRLLVPENITFSKLHKIIQASFGWLDYHLYDFDFGDTVVFFPDPSFGPGELYGEVTELNPRGEKIDSLLRERKKCFYTYDMGDDWKHEIILEDIVSAKDDCKRPLCLDGAGHRPPEDVGGAGGYEDFLEAISDPAHSEHDSYLIWAEKDTGGRKFDPHYFYIHEINRALAKIK